MSSMSEDIDEGYLSEGEVFVPKKRSKKETSNQSGSQETIAADEKHSSSTRDEKKDIHGSEQQPLSKKKKKTQKNKVCHLWLKRKCLRGKHCKYLHKKKNHRPQKPSDMEEVDASGKPKSLYAAANSPFLTVLTGFSYCKVKWRGRISSCYKYYCISGSRAYWN